MGMARRIVALLGAPGSGKSVVKHALIAAGFVELPMLEPVNRMVEHGLAIEREHLTGERLSLMAASYGQSPYALRRSLRDWGRARIGLNVWSSAWTRLALAETRDIVLTDAGYPNEVQAVRDLGGRLWRVVGSAPIERAYDRMQAEIPSDRTFTNDKALVASALAALAEDA